MEKELFEIKEKILKFCNKYKVKNINIYLQQEERYLVDDFNIITKDIDLEIDV